MRPQTGHEIDIFFSWVLRVWGFLGKWVLEEGGGEAEEVDVLGERGEVGEFDELGASGAADGVGEGVGEVCEAGLAGGVAAGEDARGGGGGVVGLETDRALWWLRRIHCRRGVFLCFCV